MVALFVVQSLYRKASLWIEMVGNFSVKLNISLALILIKI